MLEEGYSVGRYSVGGHMQRGGLQWPATDFGFENTGASGKRPWESTVRNALPGGLQWPATSFGFGTTSRRVQCEATAQEATEPTMSNQRLQVLAGGYSVGAYNAGGYRANHRFRV